MLNVVVGSTVLAVLAVMTKFELTEVMPLSGFAKLTKRSSVKTCAALDPFVKVAVMWTLGSVAAEPIVGPALGPGPTGPFGAMVEGGMGDPLGFEIVPV